MTKPMTDMPSNSWVKKVAFRLITTAKGEQFSVPIFIERLDSQSPTGWQLRYGEWTDFFDCSNSKTGASESLEKAISEMIIRINALGK